MGIYLMCCNRAGNGGELHDFFSYPCRLLYHTHTHIHTFVKAQVKRNMVHKQGHLKNDYRKSVCSSCSRAEDSYVLYRCCDQHHATGAPPSAQMWLIAKAGTLLCRQHPSDQLEYPSADFQIYSLEAGSGATESNSTLQRIILITSKEVSLPSGQKGNAEKSVQTRNA